MNRSLREHRPVVSVIDFLESVREARSCFVITDHRGDDATLWFRGQHCASWSLSPKFYRPQFSEASEPETRDLFQSRAIQLIHGRQPADKWEWYFLMQHHGAPTRLLDWTENPLIALYFAVKDHRANEDAVVWLLDPFWLNRQNGFLRKSGVSGPILPCWREADAYLVDLEDAYEGRNVTKRWPAAIEAPHVDLRLHAQGSRFVVFGTTRNLETMFSIRGKEFGLGKVSIPRTRVRYIEDELVHLGIHAASVFPDIDGLGQFVRDHWTHRGHR